MKTTTKFVAVPLMALTLLASGFMFSVNPVKAELSATGPVGANGFPLWYQDSTGLKLGLQTAADGALGLADPVIAGNAVSEAVGFGNESFYWSAEATAPLSAGGEALLVMGTEVGFLPAAVPTVGFENTFNRIRVRLISPTLAGTYNVTHPYGTTTVVVPGPGQTTTVTEDLGCTIVPGVIDSCADINPGTGKTFFSQIETLAGGGTIGAPWLRLATETIIPLNGKKYISGSGTIANGPNGNLFSVTGPATASTGTFAVTGVLFSPFVDVTPLGTSVTTPTISGTILGADALTTAAVTIGTDPANADLVPTINLVNGTWSVAVPAALPIGLHNITVVTDAGLPAESTTVKTAVLNIMPTSTSVFRFFSPAKKGHFFTTSVAEKDNLIASDPTWNFEGFAFNAFNIDAASAAPVYRFFSKAKQHHFFTISEAEKDNLVANDPTWALEGVSYTASTTEQLGTKPLFRFFSPAKKGHFFTTSVAEKDNLIANDPTWNFEGIAYYVPIN